MAHYATQEDIDELYGPETLKRVADHNRDGEPDPDVVEKGLLGADEVCNAYLSARYPVPVSPVPGVVRTCAIDIALYRMALTVTQRTTEMRQRYEDAINMLKEIAKGNIGLGVNTDADGDGTADDPNFLKVGRFLDVGRA